MLRCGIHQALVSAGQAELLILEGAWSGLLFAAAGSGDLIRSEL